MKQPHDYNEAVSIIRELRERIQRQRKALRMAEYCLDYSNDEIVTADDKHKAFTAIQEAQKI